jgi:hypothetical protein
MVMKRHPQAAELAKCASLFDPSVRLFALRVAGLPPALSFGTRRKHDLGSVLGRFVEGPTEWMHGFAKSMPR